MSMLFVDPLVAAALGERDKRIDALESRVAALEAWKATVDAEPCERCGGDGMSKSKHHGPEGSVYALPCPSCNGTGRKERK